MTKIKKDGHWIDVASLSGDDIVRNPDWDNAVQIADDTTQFSTGNDIENNGFRYTVPADGFIIGSILPTNKVKCIARINEKRIATSTLQNYSTNEDDRRWGVDVQVQVKKGDKFTIRSTTSGINAFKFKDPWIYFAPFKVQSVEPEPVKPVVVYGEADQVVTLNIANKTMCSIFMLQGAMSDYTAGDSLTLPLAYLYAGKAVYNRMDPAIDSGVSPKAEFMGTVVSMDSETLTFKFPENLQGSISVW